MWGHYKKFNGFFSDLMKLMCVLYTCLSPCFSSWLERCYLFTKSSTSKQYIQCFSSDFVSIMTSCLSAAPSMHSFSISLRNCIFLEQNKLLGTGLEMFSKWIRWKLPCSCPTELKCKLLWKTYCTFFCNISNSVISHPLHSVLSRLWPDLSVYVLPFFKLLCSMLA